MNRYLTTGDMARRTGLTPKTVRYYEQRGLLPPAARGENNYRYFELEDLRRLAFIQRAKLLGLSLAEIDQLVTVAERGECSATRSELGRILDRRLADCERRIAELISFRMTLETAARQLDDEAHSKESACCSGCASFDPGCQCVPAPLHERA